MRRIRLFIALAGLLAAGFQIMPGHAAVRTLDVEADYNTFSPQHQFVEEVGNTIRWSVLNAGENHDVTSYAGDWVDSSNVHHRYSFCSGGCDKTIEMNKNTPPFTIVFKGGSAYYRCRIHSFLTGDNVCSGMCGTLTDRTAFPDAPVISVPLGGSSVQGRPQLIAGTAEPFVLISINLSDETGTRLVGQVLSDKDGNWGVRIDLPPGEDKQVYARATDAAGRTSLSDSAAVTFTVTPDIQRPTITQSDPTTPVVVNFGTIHLQGTAADNVGVKLLRIDIRDVLPLNTTLTQKVYVRSAMCTPDCFITPQSVDWMADLLNFPTGLYSVQATAIDGSGLQAQGPQYYLLLLPTMPDLSPVETLLPVPIPAAPTVTPLPTTVPTLP